MAIFDDFFWVAASRLQHLSDLHSKFALGPHHVSKYGNIQPTAAEIRRGKKEEEDRKKLQDENIMVCPIT